MNRTLFSVLLASCFAIACISVPALADDEVIEGTVTVTKVENETKTIEIIDSKGVHHIILLDDATRTRLLPLEGKLVAIRGELDTNKQVKVKTVEEKVTKDGNKIKKETKIKEESK